MKPIPARKAKPAKPTREEILKAINWKPIKIPGAPAAAVKEENRRMQDYIVNWTQGLASHIEKVEAANVAGSASNGSTRMHRRGCRPGAKKRPRGGC